MPVGFFMTILNTDNNKAQTANTVYTKWAR